MRKQVENLAAEAGALMLAHRPHAVTKKEGHANLVTDIDEAVQRFLTERLGQICPGAELIAEEKENAPLTGRLTWVVDPIDGTTNFIHGCRSSAVSIALLKDRRPVLGVICDPYLREIYSAEAQAGARRNGEAIHVSDRPPEEALVGFGTSPYTAELNRPTMALASRCLAACADLRRSGSAALDLAHVACGRLDFYFELTLKPWDYAAGALLVREAGGIFDMPCLPEADFGASSAVLASNPACHAFAREELLREWPGGL